MNQKIQVVKWKFWTVEDVIANPDHLFLFGDNDAGRGRKGQAIIRGELNALGIPTKKFPSYRPEAYYTDAQLNRNITCIQKAINRVKDELAIEFNGQKRYKVLVLPEDGFGTGLARLPEKAPLTYRFLQGAIDDLIRNLTEDAQNF